MDFFLPVLYNKNVFLLSGGNSLVGTLFQQKFSNHQNVYYFYILKGSFREFTRLQLCHTFLHLKKASTKSCAWYFFLSDFPKEEIIQFVRIFFFKCLFTDIFSKNAPIFIIFFLLERSHLHGVPFLKIFFIRTQ